MTLSIVVVCEAEADFRTSTDLVDRIILDMVTWIEPEHLQHSRSYRGLEASATYLLWKDVREYARKWNLGFKGHFNGEPGADDAVMAWRALLLIALRFEEEKKNLDAVLLIRDIDNRPNRRKGFDQARSESKLGPRVVVGLALTNRECWVLAGFEPRSREEEHRFKNIREELGFNPNEKPERLTAMDETAKLSAKRVLTVLVGKNADREAACWRDTPLHRLRERGEKTGLRLFIEEIEQRIVPLLGWEKSN